MLKSSAVKSLTDIILDEAKAYIEQRIRDEGEKIILEAQSKALKNTIMVIREDIISDRLVMTLEMKKNDK